MPEYRLCFDIRSWWHVGSGRGSGSLLQANVLKDRNDLPYLPGRTVKGLVRDAVSRAEGWGWFASNPEKQNPEKEPNPTAAWFGSLARVDADTGEVAGRFETQPGALAFGDAVLPEDLCRWLADPGNAALREGLYGEVHATAIDSATGVAETGTLRGHEVTIPLKLYAPIQVLSPTEVAPDWVEKLATCLPLIRGLGVARNRGLGRAVVTLEEVPA